MKVDVWSDIACPFCYIGKAQFELALADFAHKDEVKVVYRSFQLDPTLPRDYDGGIHDMLANKLGKTPEEAKQLNDTVDAQADTYGLSYDMDKLVVTNTEDAHRLTHLAAEHGKQIDMVDRLYRAYFSEGKHVGDHQTLADLAAEVGLDRQAALEALENGEYKEQVAGDMSEANQLGIRGVPFYLIDQKYGMSGAQGEKVFLEALQKAWHEQHPIQMVGDADSAVCTDGICSPS